ncbi:unnamed protein product [Prorocentrum cordatum]|uniref:EF-hand domain-containing protein n=1 Tax=Prorocentrum cordatum TaxID=2364126 RepID=A0ABN9TP72_9DINO|nr:unnamed protein product [Polarella glacialis]
MEFARKTGAALALEVTGCTSNTVASIIRGHFVPYSENHGRVVYRKQEQAANGVDVQIYFWDERDGADFSGWWFGPKVGGDQVWAYNPEKAAVPPSGGWRVPFGGPVDAQFVVSPAAQQPLGQQAPNMQPPNMQPPSMQPPSMQPPSMPRQPGPSGAQGQQAQGGVVQAAQGQLQQLLSFLPQHQQVLSQQQMQLVREACQTQPQQVQQLLGSLLQEQRHAQAQMQQAQMGVQAQMQQMQAMGNVAGVHHLQQTFAMQTAQLQQQHMALQQRHMQQLGQLASNQQASVAAKKQKMEETRQKLEEQRRQMQEQAKKRQEELAAKLAEEKLRRETEMKRRIVEQRVQLSIRRILVKLRAATPDTYDAAEKELEDLLQQELEQNCYVPSDQVKQEIEVVREKQRQRIEQLRVQQEAARKRREEQQKKHDDLKLRAEELVKELDGYVAQAESASKHLDDVLAPLEGNGEMNCDEIEEMGKGVAAAEVQARTAFNVCNDFMVKHNAEMRVPPAQAASPGPMRPPGEAAPPDTGPATQQLLADLVGRINACREKQLAAASSVPQARERAKRKAAALQLNTELQAVLSRYDSDGDGALSRKDVQKLAKQEFGFDLPDAVLSKISGPTWNRRS